MDGSSPCDAMDRPSGRASAVGTMAVAVTPAVAIADEVLALAHSPGEVLMICEDASVNDVNVNAFAVDFAGIINAIDGSVHAVDAHVASFCRTDA